MAWTPSSACPACIRWRPIAASRRRASAFSAIAMNVEQVHELTARAFALFASARPRPVHISIPLDVLTMPDGAKPRRRPAPRLPLPEPADIEAAAELLGLARRPVIIA